MNDQLTCTKCGQTLDRRTAKRKGWLIGYTIAICADCRKDIGKKKGV